MLQSLCEIGGRLACGSEAFEPGAEFVEHLVVVAEGVAEAPSVAAGGVDVEGGGDAVGQEGGVVVDGVGRGDGTVVAAEDQEGAGCFGSDLFFV